MSSNEILQPSTIKVLLKGLMVMFTNDPTKCTVGLLRDAPFHNLKIEAQKKRRGEPQFTTIGTFENDDAAGTFNLVISNTGNEGIRRRREDEKPNRLNDPDSDSFNWVVDFESDFFETEIGASKQGFISFLILNNGEIFTRKVSENHLQFRRPPSTKWIDFGRVAVEMGVEIKLDRENSKALFTKEGQANPVFQSEPETDYQIIVDRDDSQHPSGNDANLYFKAIGTTVRAGQQIQFRSFPPLVPLANNLPPVTPDAACPTTKQSRSGI